MVCFCYLYFHHVEMKFVFFQYIFTDKIVYQFSFSDELLLKNSDIKMKEGEHGILNKSFHNLLHIAQLLFQFQ